MPHYEVARVDIDDVIDRIDKNPLEELVGVLAAGDGAFDVFTKQKPKVGRPAKRVAPGELETRS